MISVPPGVAITGDQQLNGNVNVAGVDQVGDGHDDESVGTAAGFPRADAQLTLGHGQDVAGRMRERGLVLDQFHRQMAVVGVGYGAHERHRRRHADVDRSAVLEELDRIHRMNHYSGVEDLAALGWVHRGAIFGHLSQQRLHVAQQLQHDGDIIVISPFQFQIISSKLTNENQ